VLSSNFNPQNTQGIPAVKIIAFLELEQKSAFFKGLSYTYKIIRMPSFVTLYLVFKRSVYNSKPYKSFKINFILNILV